jgi:uncharacterized protein YkwD
MNQNMDKAKISGSMVTGFIFIVVIASSSCGLFMEKNPEKIASDVFRLINEHRISQGLAECKWNEILAWEACRHSQNMATGELAIGHEGYEIRKKAICLQIPFSGYSEIVAFVSNAFSPAERVVEYWLGSDDHKRAIEGKFDLSGVGAANKGNVFYITQIFIRQ